MKKLLLVCLLTLTSVYAKESVEFKYAPQTIERNHPSSQNYILSYSNILENVRTSIVNISIKKEMSQSELSANPFFNDPFFREFFKGYGQIPQERIQKSLGSGVIVSQNGYIITNNHVVEEADEIIVNLAGDKKEYEAKLIGRDEKSDLAVIKIEAKNLNAITFFDSDKVKVGDIVFALGNPFGVGETITQGIVSATRRSGVGIVEYEDFIQTDASINPGNSGGALINSAGQLIGINSAIISKSGGNVGIGFAIPSNMATTVATSLIDNGKYTRAYLGVTISDIGDDMSNFYNDNYGALITGVEENSPAAKAGLKRGDLIISVNDKKIQSASELKNTIGSQSPSKSVSIKFLREKKINTINVALTTLDNQTINGELSYRGIKLVQINSTHKQQLNIALNGVIVVDVNEKSEAYNAGIRKNDIIVQIEDYEITNLDDFKKATETQGKKRVFVYRRGGIFAVVL
ncbi:MAG: peptidase S1 [Sulfurimonas sp. RIFOXYD12_FULL_33_39]|uniref:Do family serine endopeptidase n=1 Tax=unclassified Sulfurimonas TaxID=2623549 RepID=UPI0008BC31B8|nr:MULTISPECIES: Do family serine endopeptidase [unclassified Sulfurimonas]OHE07492.1 MAG: peptidase S1 [Sulfurimonas sp. RIFCSPLOWO2_12_FULL_34_6]OHE10943.1 MAG: peptidase S1 [Sulfurimonas sp. RIFOXYD12_FULL_33_39]OHE13288.1 MAG: peptidase S1 [Sulfurimonas sp. RIFOXYD2_FULL_34_21]DAB27573.1 MAG TPA: peptidase S1 [Sulfurimonas sp. UBA10385]